MRYSELDPNPVRATISVLARRIEERFPSSGLLGVAEELLRTADRNEKLIAQLRRPIWWLRALSVLGALALLALVIWAALEIRRMAALGQGSLSEIPLTQEQLIRYLDYCSELLSLISKLAALQAQHLQDAVVLEAVNEIESLSSDLSRKIWQKITILNS